MGIHDNFFDLGGHSLLATQVLRRIGETFRSDVSISQFFEAQTIAELARRLTKLEKAPGQTEKIAVLRQRLERMSGDEVAQAIARHQAPQTAAGGTA